MEEDNYIDFLMDLDIEGLHFQPHRPEGIEFVPPGEGGLRLVLKPTKPDEDACGHLNGLTCRIYKSYPATNEQVLFAKSHNSEPKIITRLANGISLPYKSKDRVFIDAEGICADGFRPYRHICPSDIINLIECAETELLSNGNRFLKLLRWRQDCDAQANIIKHHTLYWRVGHGNYQLAPPKDDYSGPITVQSMFGIHWSERHSTDLEELWIGNDIDEPLGHTLLREAISLRKESPRASILIMITALESAVKTHISRLAPDTEWLMENIPSPPIDKLLYKYLPIIHGNRDNHLSFWHKLKPLFKRVQDLNTIRNKIAHTGKIPEDAGSIKEHIKLISDFLYLLDVLDGQEWAKSLVSSELRKNLGWPEPKEKRMNIIISQLQ